MTKAEHQKKEHENELAATPTSRCRRDTNGDGDCQVCECRGCPLQFFRPCLIEQARMGKDEQEAFIKDATPFTYTELDTSTLIKGFRGRDGKILITETNLLRLFPRGQSTVSELPVS